MMAVVMPMAMDATVNTAMDSAVESTMGPVAPHTHAAESMSAVHPRGVMTAATAAKALSRIGVRRYRHQRRKPDGKREGCA